MYVIRQQQVIATLENHRMIRKVLPVKLQTRESYDEAIRLVYDSFADSDAQSQYSVISNGGKFIRSIKLGELDGFRNPGNI